MIEHNSPSQRSSYAENDTGTMIEHKSEENLEDYANMGQEEDIESI